MTTCNVYTRSLPIFIGLTLLYGILSFAALGAQLDNIPDPDDNPFIILWLAGGGFLVSLLLAQLSTIASMRLVVYDQRIELHLLRNNILAPKPDSVIWYAEIRDVQLKKSIDGDSYILLLLNNGNKVRLHSRPFLLRRNKSFYEAFIALTKMIADYANAGNNAILTDEVKEEIIYHNTDSEAPAILLERKPLQYLGLFFIMLFYWGYAGGLCLAIGIGDEDGPNFVAIAVSICGFLMGTYHLSHFLKISPKTRVYASSISIGAKRYMWKDLEAITISGKVPYKYLFINHPLDGIMLRFKDGSIHYIYDGYYRNTEGLKAFVRKVVLNNPKYAHVVVTDPNSIQVPLPINTAPAPTQTYTHTPTDLRYENIQYYKGNPLTTVLGVLSWGCTLVIPLLVTLISGEEIMLPILIVTFLLMIFLPLSFTFYYFGLAKGRIVVSNHHLFWVRKVYNLADISEAIIGLQGSDVKYLSLTFKSYKSVRYRATSLRDENWLALKQALLKAGVPVRDELKLEVLLTPENKKMKRVFYRGVAIFFLALTAVVLPLSFYEPETTSGLVLKAVLVLVAIGVYIISMRKFFSWLGKKYADKPKEE